MYDDLTLQRRHEMELSERRLEREVEDEKLADLKRRLDQRLEQWSLRQYERSA